MASLLSGKIIRMKKWLVVSGRAFLYVLLAFSVYGNLYNLTAVKLKYIHTVHFPRGTLRLTSEPSAQNLREVVAFISLRTNPMETIFVYHTSPLLYLLLDRSNATPYNDLIPGCNTALQINDALEHLQRKHPRVIIQDGFAEFFSRGGYFVFPFADRSLFVSDPIKTFVSWRYNLVRKGNISIYETREGSSTQPKR